MNTVWPSIGCWWWQYSSAYLQRFCWWLLATWLACTTGVNIVFVTVYEDNAHPTPIQIYCSQQRVESRIIENVFNGSQRERTNYSTSYVILKFVTWKQWREECWQCCIIWRIRILVKRQMYAPMITNDELQCNGYIQTQPSGGGS